MLRNDNGKNTTNGHEGNTRGAYLNGMATGAVLTLTVACIVLLLVTCAPLHAKLFLFTQTGVWPKLGSATTGAGIDSGFTLKGIYSMDTEIEGETHRLVCYHATVTDFKISENEAQAGLIGADEKFTTRLQSDGSITYHATYYEQSGINTDLGFKVVKDFMDCGTGSQDALAMADVPLSVDINVETKYLSDATHKLFPASTVPADAFN